MKKENILGIASEAIDIYAELTSMGVPKEEAKEAAISGLKMALGATNMPLDKRWDNFLARKSAP